MPTLLLMGSESPPALQASSRALAAALPNSQVEVLLGQGHTAMYTAPGMFAEVVLTFLRR
jgi:pimeloyl-ACP methyl ester carboxylesterase